MIKRTNRIRVWNEQREIAKRKKREHAKSDIVHRELREKSGDRAERRERKR